MMLSLLLVLLSDLLFGQLVNIEIRRMQTDSVRHAGNLNISFSYTDNNNKSLLVSKNSLAYQYKNKSLKNIFLVLGDFSISRSSSQDYTNAAFGHLRYNRKINSWLRWEMFSQMQYNHLLAVKFRSLLGTGPRFKWMNRKKITSYLGTLYMFEYEETQETIPQIHRHHRMSCYLTLDIDIPGIGGEIVSTAYYQPRINLLNDFRFLQQTKLVFSITKRVKWNTGFSFLYDSFPPEGVSARAISIDQGLRIDL